MKTPKKLIEIMNIDFEEWHYMPEKLLNYDVTSQIIKNYLGNLPKENQRKAFFKFSFSQWEESMRYNMGGGLPVKGFWELKNALYTALYLIKDE